MRGFFVSVEAKPVGPTFPPDPAFKAWPKLSIDRTPIHMPQI